MWRQVLFFCVIGCLLIPSQAGAVVPLTHEGPQISAASAVLLDEKSGLMLWGKNPHLQRAPASTTKILTALLIAERCDLNDLVQVSQRAAHTGGSSAYLHAGERLRVRDLLYGLLLVSGNDAAVALAEHCAGSVEEFADLMNARVRQLGGYDSHFTNPHGLPDPEHYTTAYDLSLITRQALRNPILAQIVASRSETIPRTGGDGQQFLANRNRMLWSYPGADGVKTGYTRAAGRCLVSSATRAGRQVIAVVLGSAAIWDDSRTVLDFGFEAFDYCQLVAREEIVREIAVAGVVEPVPLAARQGLVLPMWQGEQAAWEQNIQIAEGIKAPLRAGQVLGQFQVSHRTTGNVVAVDLIVTKDVFRRPGLLTRAVRCFLGVWEGLYDRLPRRPVPNLG